MLAFFRMSRIQFENLGGPGDVCWDMHETLYQPWFLKSYFLIIIKTHRCLDTWQHSKSTRLNYPRKISFAEETHSIQYCVGVVVAYKFSLIHIHITLNIPSAELNVTQDDLEGIRLCV